MSPRTPQRSSNHAVSTLSDNHHSKTATSGDLYMAHYEPTAHSHNMSGLKHFAASGSISRIGLTDQRYENDSGLGTLNEVSGT